MAFGRAFGNLCVPGRVCKRDEGEVRVKAFFMVSFVVAVVLEIVVVAVLVRQAWRQGRDKSAPAPTVVRRNEIVTAVALFGASMIVVSVIRHGWDGIDANDVLLFAMTFGIVTAAILQRFRGRMHAAATAAVYALPVGFGVVAGIVGSAAL